MKVKDKSIIKDFLNSETKALLSEWDIRQNFGFSVLLAQGNTLARAMLSLPKAKRVNVKFKNIPPEDLGEMAIEAFYKAIPIKLLIKYRKHMEHEVVREMMKLYPNLQAEFNKLVYLYDSVERGIEN